MRTEPNAIQRLHDVFVRVVCTLQSPFLLVIRLYWGWQFAQTGWGKLHSLPQVTEYFASLGLPAPGFTATFVATFEFVGGILLAVGLLSRITALGMVIDMIMAYVAGDKEALHAFFSNFDKFYNAAPYIFLFVGLIILIFGPGKLSLDTLLDRMIRKRKYSGAVDASSSGT
jgi:putative oxidoreductase